MAVSMVSSAVYDGLWSQRFSLVFIFVVYQQTDLNAKRQESDNQAEAFADWG